MRIALAQLSLGTDLTQNLTRALDALARAAEGRAELVIYPELCLSPFFPQFAQQDVTRYALTLEDEPIRQFQMSCRKHAIAASPNVYLREGGRLFDASLVIAADGRLLGISKMVHIAQLPGFYEQDYYTPSDTGFRVFDTVFGNIGIVVCFDRHYPESVRTCTLRGASLVIVPTANTVDEPGDIFECELRAAAYQNGVFISMCNRVGQEGDALFCGESIVVDCDGRVVAKTGAKETLVLVDVDLAAVARARTRRPYLALRRPESYER